MHVQQLIKCIESSAREENVKSQFNVTEILNDNLAAAVLCNVIRCSLRTRWIYTVSYDIQKCMYIVVEYIRHLVHFESNINTFCSLFICNTYMFIICSLLL